jgi:hypothetical protein
MIASATLAGVSHQSPAATIDSICSNTRPAACW